MAEKCIEQFPLRLPEDMLREVKRLAADDDRSPSDYIRLVLARHLYGHARSVREGADLPQGCNASQCDARKSGDGR